MKNKNRIYALVSVVFLLGSIFVFYLLFSYIESKRFSITNKVQEWQTEENRRSEIKSLERVVKNLQKERQEIDAHFVSAENPVEFFNSLEDLARSVGGEASVISVNTDNSNQTFGLTMEAIGSFDAMYRFMILLENSFYKMKIKTLDFQAIPQDLSSEWSLKITLELITFNKI